MSSFSKDVANLYVRGAPIARIYNEHLIEIRKINLGREEADELRKWLGQVMQEPVVAHETDAPNSVAAAAFAPDNHGRCPHGWWNVSLCGQCNPQSETDGRI